MSLVSQTLVVAAEAAGIMEVALDKVVLALLVSSLSDTLYEVINAL